MKFKKDVTFITAHTGYYKNTYFWSTSFYDTNNSSLRYRKGKQTRTMVVIWPKYDSKRLAEGEALCGWNDKPNFRLGVDIALGRAIKALGE